MVLNHSFVTVLSSQWELFLFNSLIDDNCLIIENHSVLIVTFVKTTIPHRYCHNFFRLKFRICTAFAFSISDE